MPRQKQIVSEIKHNSTEEDIPQFDKNDCNETSQPSEADSEDDYSSTSDTEFDHLSSDELVALAEDAEKSGDLEQTVRLCDRILTRKCRELRDETSPELGEHWLNYGNALLSKEEMTGELFSTTKEKENEALEIAWNSLDLARICLEKGLNKILSKEKDVIDIVEFCSKYLNGEEKLSMKVNLTDADERKASLLRFAHLRMGDLKQSSHDYEGAIEEFSASLQLSVRYCRDVSKGLAAAIPLTQCFMALDHEGTDLVYKLCNCLIEYELEQEDVSADRKSLLLETQSDLTLQLEDYMQNRNDVLDELKKLLQPDDSDQAVDSVEEEKSRKRPASEESPVLDLGKLGKKKNSENSSQKPL